MLERFRLSRIHGNRKAVCLCSFPKCIERLRGTAQGTERAPLQSGREETFIKWSYDESAQPDGAGVCVTENPSQSLGPDLPLAGSILAGGDPSRMENRRLPAEVAGLYGSSALLSGGSWCLRNYCVFRRLGTPSESLLPCSCSGIHFSRRASGRERGSRTPGAFWPPPRSNLLSDHRLLAPNS